MLTDFLTAYSAHEKRAVEQKFKPLTRPQCMAIAIKAITRNKFMGVATSK